jgi:hypothetical protein
MRKWIFYLMICFSFFGCESKHNIKNLNQIPREFRGKYYLFNEDGFSDGFSTIIIGKRSIAFTNKEGEVSVNCIVPRIQLVESKESSEVLIKINNNDRDKCFAKKIELTFSNYNYRFANFKSLTLYYQNPAGFEDQSGEKVNYGVTETYIRE